MAEEASPRPSSPASTMEPLEMGAEIPAPRMRKDSVLVYVAEESSGHVTYVPQRIKLDSPRWREAMVDSGMEMRQLGEQPLLGPYGTKNANKSVLRRRKAAWEKLRAKNLGVVLRFRQEKVEVRARCLRARLCASV